jgi:hypothetical protein
MKSFKTAVKIWKKEMQFKLTVWKIDEVARDSSRIMRQNWIKDTKQVMISDLINRHRIGDIILTPEDLKTLQNPKGTLVFSVIEEIYKRNL